jgi:hypothetical protein
MIRLLRLAPAGTSKRDSIIGKHDEKGDHDRHLERLQPEYLGVFIMGSMSAEF